MYHTLNIIPRFTMLSPVTLSLDHHAGIDELRKYITDATIVLVIHKSMVMTAMTVSHSSPLNYQSLIPPDFSTCPQERSLTNRTEWD
jgi:hypothetical protein